MRFFSKSDGRRLALLHSLDSLSAIGNRQGGILRFLVDFVGLSELFPKTFLSFFVILGLILCGGEAKNREIFSRFL